MNRLKTFLFTATLVSGASAAHGVTIVWEQEYLPSNGLPSDVNASWTFAAGGGSSSIVTAGYNGQDTLLIDSALADFGYWNFTDGWNGASANGSTLEFVMKVTRDEGATAASQIFWSAGEGSFDAGLKLATGDGGQIDDLTASNNSASVDFTAWHHWRLVVNTDGTSSLYMDDNADAVWTAAPGGVVGSQLLFGDGGTVGVGGEMEIAMIRWTNSGAFDGAPVPEPGSLALGLLGGAMLLAGRRRRSA